MVVKVCSDAEERVGCGKQREATAPNQSLVKLQSCFLSLQWKTSFRQNCSLGSCACSEGPAFGLNTYDDDDDDDDVLLDGFIHSRAAVSTGAAPKRCTEHESKVGVKGARE